MITVVVGKEIEKVKGDYESYLNGLNMVGEISYSQYSELYDEGIKQIQKAYELGKSELEKENAELNERLGDIQMQKAGEKSDLVWKLKTENEQKALRMKERDELLAELEAKIERMKCCQNCMHYRHYTSDVTECAMSFVAAQNCRHNSFDKWEFKETKEK